MIKDEYLEAFKSSRFGQLRPEPWDFEVELPSWTLDKLIPAKSIGLIYGPSNSGKSHLVCSLINSMICGDTHWIGRPLCHGPVLMFSESLGHIRARILAYREASGKQVKHDLYSFPTMNIQAHEMAFLGMWISLMPVQPSMVVFDTLATSFDLDENDNREASQLIKQIEDHILPAISESGTVLIVHHTSKASDGNSARGASALIGNIDYSINVKWNAEAERTVAEWHKDRWRLVEDNPMWAGTAQKHTVNFTNGSTEITALDWFEWNEDELEAAKQMKEEAKIHHLQEALQKDLMGEFMPVYIHTKGNAKIPGGMSPYSLTKCVKDTRLHKTVRDWMIDTFDTEPVFNSNGTETGFLIKKI